MAAVIAVSLKLSFLRTDYSVAVNPRSVMALWLVQQRDAGRSQNRIASMAAKKPYAMLLVLLSYGSHSLAMVCEIVGRKVHFSES